MMFAAGLSVKFCTIRVKIEAKAALKHRSASRARARAGAATGIAADAAIDFNPESRLTGRVAAPIFAAGRRARSSAGRATDF